MVYFHKSLLNFWATINIQQDAIKNIIEIFIYLFNPLSFKLMGCRVVRTQSVAECQFRTLAYYSCNNCYFSTRTLRVLNK